MHTNRLVMIPGPTPTIRSIEDQMGRPVTAFGDPAFVKDYKGVIDDLNHLWNNDGGACFVVAATGSLAMEMAISNNLQAGEHILIVSHGFFGDRFITICEKKELHIDVLSAPWGEIIPVHEIEAKLKEKTYAAVTVTHVDTSTGVAAPIKEIGDMMKQFPDTLFIVDGVCSSAGQFEDMKAMNIDVLFTGSQKAFGVSPGLMMLWASKKSLEKRETLGNIREYYADYDKWLPIMEDPGKYFATPAINLVWAMKESVRIIKEETLEKRAKRHEKNARGVQKAMETLGFQVLAKAPHRSTTMSNFIYFDGIDDLTFRNTLYDEGVIVAGALASYAGKAWRMGHMGNASFNDFVTTIATVEKVLLQMGKLKTKPGEALGVFLEETK